MCTAIGQLLGKFKSQEWHPYIRSQSKASTAYNGKKRRRIKAFKGLSKRMCMHNDVSIYGKLQYGVF